MTHRRMRNFNGLRIPSAARWEVHTCLRCPNMHVILFDDDDVPFAEMLLSRDTLKVLNTKGTELLDKLRDDNLRRQL